MVWGFIDCRRFQFPPWWSNNRHAKRFVDILDGFGLQQHVKRPTHKKGHTLDLIISRSVVGQDVALVWRVKVRDPCIADHFSVHCELLLQKPRFGKKVVKFRKLRSIDIDSSCGDLRDSDLLLKSYLHLNTLVEQYDRTLLSILDKHAPEMQRQITVRPSAPRYTQEVADEKNKRRRLERKWRKSKMQSDRERYVRQRYVINNLICNLKTTYCREIISKILVIRRFSLTL